MPNSLVRTRRRFRLPEPPEVSFINLACVCTGLLLAKLNWSFLETSFEENLYEHVFLIAPRGFVFVTVYFLMVKSIVYRGVPFSLLRRMQIHLVCVALGFVLGNLAFYQRVDWVYLASAGAVIQLSALTADIVTKRWLE